LLEMPNGLGRQEEDGHPVSRGAGGAGSEPGKLCDVSRRWRAAA
jgi:hypothetical protein